MMQSGYTVKRYSELPKTITLTRRSHSSIEVLPIAHLGFNLPTDRGNTFISACKLNSVIGRHLFFDL